MINNKKPEKAGQYKQMELWENIISDPGPSMKASMNEAIKRCSLSREEIVDRINGLAQLVGITCNGRTQKVTLSLLDKWVAPGAKNYNIPIRLLPIFCKVVGSNLPLQAYSSFFEDARIISTEDHKKLEWAKAEINARNHRKNASKLAQEVGI